MSKNKSTPISSELYTAEASEGQAKAQEEVSLPDPTPEQGKAAITLNEVCPHHPTQRLPCSICEWNELQDQVLVDMGR